MKTLFKDTLSKNHFKFIIPSFIVLIAIVLSLIFGIKYLRIENQKSDALNELKMVSNKINSAIFTRMNESSKTLASHPLIIKIFEGIISPRHNDISIVLDTFKKTYGVSIVYVLNVDGEVIASTTYDKGKTIIGENYHFRKYFKEALTGKDTIYPAIGITTKKRGIYFSSPVYIDTGISKNPSSSENVTNTKKISKIVAGVVVLKLGTELLEKLLHLSELPIHVLSQENIIFATNKEEWLLHTLSPLTDATRLRLHREKQFGGLLIPLIKNKNEDGSIVIDGKKYFSFSMPFPIKNWRISLIDKIEPNYPLTPFQIFFIFLAAVIISNLILIIIAMWIKSQKNKFNELKIVEREKKLHKILYNNSIPFIYFSTKGEIKDINKAFSKMLHKKKSELIGIPLLAFIEEKEKSFFSHQLTKAILHNSVIFTTKFTGSEEPSMIQLSSLIDEDDQLIGYTGFVSSIPKDFEMKETPRKQKKSTETDETKRTREDEVEEIDVKTGKPKDAPSKKPKFEFKKPKLRKPPPKN